MSVFVVSIPKSGTYLLAALLAHWGFQRSGYHFVHGGISYYPPGETDVETARRNPGVYTCARDRQEVLAEIRRTPEAFAVGHVPRAWQADLSGFRLIFPIRDLRECLISRARRLAQTGRLSVSSSWSSENGERILYEALRQHAFGEFVNVLKYASQWAIAGWQPQVDFQDIVGRNGSQAQERVLHVLARYLDKAPVSVEEVREKVLDRETLTCLNGSDHIEWTQFWSDRVQDEFNRQGLAEVNRALGYEA